MEHIKLLDAAKAMHAHIIGEPRWSASHVYTDTRAVRQESGLFFALAGPKTDGHHFVEAAFKHGAAAAVVETEIPGAGTPQFVVGNTLKALGDLARVYRDMFAIPVVGVTGSVGKTSTKEMTALAVGSQMSVVATELSQND